jgi:hypothetical protein
MDDLYLLGQTLSQAFKSESAISDNSWDRLLIFAYMKHSLPWIR